MKIRGKITLVALSLPLVAPVQAASCSVVDRLVDVIQERPASIVFNPLDPHHQKMLALNIYSSTEIDQMDAASYVWFRNNYGMDFENDVPGYSHILADPVTGIRNLFINNQLTATLLPYMTGQEKNLKLVYDSKYPLRGLVRDWYQVEPGNLVIFARDGVFDYGTNATAQFKANDNAFYGYVNLVRDNASPSLPVIYEEFPTTSYQLGKTPINQWGNIEYLLTLKLADKNNKEGFGISSTVTIKKPQGSSGTSYVILHNTYTWPCQ